MATGRFISFEGIDGAGKTTQIDGLERLIRAAGHEVVRTREPGGTPLGEKIRGLLLTDEMTPRTETLLFFAARCEHAEKVIKPALERGAWVLSDRFTDATYAYQTGGKGMKGEDVEALEAWTLAGFAPDVTVLRAAARSVRAKATGSNARARTSSPACATPIWTAPPVIRSASSGSMPRRRPRRSPRSLRRSSPNGSDAVPLARGGRRTP